MMSLPLKLLLLMPLVALLVMLNSCSFLPLPITYINNSKSVYDAVAFIKGDPTSNDMVLSSLTGKECRIINVIDQQDICKEPNQTALVEKMFEMDCYTYRFKGNESYCVENELASNQETTDNSIE